MTKLSIITICYNEPDLEKTCKSIVSQTNQDFEWVVIDGGSNKETQDIWDKYKSRINKFVSEKDNGIYNACNKGIRLASGEYVLFINAGDNLHSNKVIEQIMNSDFSEDIVYGSLFWKNRLFNKDYGKIPMKFFMTKCLPTPATMIKKELYEKYGYLDESYKIVSDLKAYITFFRNNVSYKYIPVIVSDFDTNGISSSKKYKEIHLQERNKLFDESFTKEEIKDALLHPYIKNSFWENIFSVKNTFKKIYKVVTILGIQVRIKVKEYEE